MYVSYVFQVSNKYVKHLVKLRESRSYREETQKVLIVGSIPVSETLGYEPVCIR